jgi:hypothetical protein
MRDVELDDRDLRIGRGEQNDIVLLDSTKSVSRAHAELRFEGGSYVLIDANSQNGIWSGGQRLPRIELQPGVPVLVGSYRLVLDDAPIPSETLPGGVTVPGVHAAPAAAGYTPPVAASVPAGPVSSRPPVRARQSAFSPQAMLFGAVALLLVLTVGVTMWMRSRRPVERPADPPIAEGPVTPGPTIADPVSEHLAKARSHMDAQEYDDALAEVEQVLALDAANTEAADIKLRASQLKAPPPPTPVEKTVSAAPPKPSPPPPPSKPAGPAPTILKRSNETEEEWYRRNATNMGLYEKGKAALASQDYRTAVNSLEQLLNDEPLYQNAPSLLGQARAGLTNAAQASQAEAAKLEASNDLRGALRLYRNVQQQYNVSTEAEQERIRGKMKAEGTKAFNDAETNFSMRRSKQALALYERAYDYLTDEDPNRKVAKDRLDALRGQQ